MNDGNSSRPRIVSVTIPTIIVKSPRRVASQNTVVEPRRPVKELKNQLLLSPSSPAKLQPVAPQKAAIKEKKFPIFSNPSLLKTFVTSPSQPANSASSPPSSPQLKWDSRWGDGREIIYQSYTAELQQADMLPDESQICDVPTQPRLRSPTLTRHALAKNISVKLPKEDDPEKFKQSSSLNIIVETDQ